MIQEVRAERDHLSIPENRPTMYFFLDHGFNLMMTVLN